MEQFKIHLNAKSERENKCGTRTITTIIILYLWYQLKLTANSPRTEEI